MQLEINTPGLWRRMASWLYEGILMFGVAFIADYLFDTFSQSHHALANRNLRMAFMFVIFGIYFVWFWAKGQTLAMKTWDIRIVDRAGQPISQTRALGRYCLSWLWLLPPLAAIAPYHASAPAIFLVTAGWIIVWAILSRFHSQSQFWHDALAGTRLVSLKPIHR